MLGKRRNNNRILIGTLLIMALAMVVGYAALSTSLSVNGTGTIASTTSFDVKFTGVAATTTGRATSNHTTFAGGVTSSSFSFDVTLNQPGDKMEYLLTIKNIGTIDAEIGSFTNPETWATGNILTYGVTGITVGEAIDVGKSKNVTLIVEWPTGTNIPTNKTQNLEFTINYVQKTTRNGGGGVVPVVSDSGFTLYDNNWNNQIDQGDQVLFGTYPQTIVTDNTLITILNTRAGTLPTNGSNGTWTSYGYYQGVGPCDEYGNYCSGINNEVDFTWYQDIEENGEKYRGVYFTAYRPYYTNDDINNDISAQYAEGYMIETTYWFKYESILWNVGKTENNEATLISATALDSREFYPDNVERNIDGNTIYPNNYAYSTVRAWLNSSFYDTAFTVNEKIKILTTEVDNGVTSVYDSGNPYLTSNTYDKIFLLSANDIDKNSIIHNLKSIAGGSDYAKSQGLNVNSDNGKVNYWLRSPYYETETEFETEKEASIMAYYIGTDFTYDEVEATFNGIIMVMKISTTSGNEPTIVQAPVYKYVDTNNNSQIDQGDQILFGKYPQYEVSMYDTALISYLNQTAGPPPTSENSRTWTSYGYYYGNGYNSETNIPDYAWYQDIEVGNSKYRGIYFTGYRPYFTFKTLSVTSIDTRKYLLNTVYWFEYVDIIWDIGKVDNNELTLISQDVLDAHEFYLNDSWRTIDGNTIYSNNYEYSTVRTWLNGTFYNTAFNNQKEKEFILLEEVDNSPATMNNAEYVSNNTMDKVFLLSYKDIRENLATYNIPTAKVANSYARAQGANLNENYSYYWLRSPKGLEQYAYYTRTPNYADIINDCRVESITGIVPVIKVELPE